MEAGGGDGVEAGGLGYSFLLVMDWRRRTAAAPLLCD